MHPKGCPEEAVLKMSLRGPNLDGREVDEFWVPPTAGSQLRSGNSDTEQKAEIVREERVERLLKDQHHENSPVGLDVYSWAVGQGQPVYPITTGGFRHPYPTALTVNASMSRFPPHMVPPHHTLHTTGIPHPAIVTPTVKQESSQSDVGSLHSAKHQDSKKEEEKKKPHIKKPLNAFMLYMKEMRAKVVAECTLKESAAINQILGRRWHALSREEQAKYYELARKERQLHMQLYPGWSARDNYGKKKKRKRDKQPGETNDAKSQTEQTQPLSLSLKPDPLAHLSMMPPPPALLLAEAAHGKAPALCANGALDLPHAALQPPAIPSASLAQPSTSSLHSHNSLAGTQPQPLSLVTKSLE
ncbi:hypothetical protein CB1_000678036 [Camelus ferus]|nr:hypothetical protein CB1_000678036 [Camelus ferus]